MVFHGYDTFTRWIKLYWKGKTGQERRGGNAKNLMGQLSKEAALGRKQKKTRPLLKPSKLWEFVPF